MILLKEYRAIAEAKTTMEICVPLLGMLKRHTDVYTIQNIIKESLLDITNKNRSASETITKIEYVPENAAEFSDQEDRIEQGILALLNEFLEQKNLTETEEKCIAMLLFTKALHGIMYQISFSIKIRGCIDNAYNVLFESRSNCVEALSSYLDSIGLILHSQYAQEYSKDLFLQSHPAQLWERAMKNAWEKGEGSKDDNLVKEAYQKYLNIRTAYRDSSVSVKLESLYGLFTIGASTYRQSKNIALRKLMNFYEGSLHSDYLKYLIAEIN